MLNERKTEAYCAILVEELLLATGCTEPIAVAYCAAKLREVLGGKPEKVLAEVSGNILKNVKSVVVPNTGGRRGIDAAIAVGQVLLEKPMSASAEDNLQDKSVLNVKDILTFIETVPIDRIRPLISRQIQCNGAIAAEGLRGDWGANIGSTLLSTGSGIETEARAWGAAGSDARMNGCEMPVVICSGSGNQGITASVPVWRYGLFMGASEEKILRAVALSDLITIHQKTGIGRLSAYCGAVSAGVGAGCGIAWLRGADYDGVSHTICNAVAMISGCICDGAKASCASKIAMAIGTGILGYNMYLGGNNFRPGDGIEGTDVEDTIRNVGILASKGMHETDRVILNIMTGR